MTGMPAPTILFTIFMDEVMIIMGLVGAVTNTSELASFQISNFQC